MAAPLEPKLAELLVRLVEMDDGNYETFQPYFPGNGPLNEAILLNKREETIPEGPTKELADRGYLDMEPTTKRLGNFRIAEQGRTLAAQLASAREGAVNLSWPTVEPILIQIHKLWLNEGAPLLASPARPSKPICRQPKLRTFRPCCMSFNATAGSSTGPGWDRRCRRACGQRPRRSVTSRAGRPTTPGLQASSS